MELIPKTLSVPCALCAECAGKYSSGSMMECFGRSRAMPQEKLVTYGTHGVGSETDGRAHQDVSHAFRCSHQPYLVEKQLKCYLPLQICKAASTTLHGVAASDLDEYNLQVMQAMAKTQHP